MDFFQRQELAKRKTFLLLCYFVFCVACIILAVYAVCMLLLFYAQYKIDTHIMLQWWDQRIFFSVSIITILIVFLGSAYKTHVLSKDASSIALMLGGRLVDPGTSNDQERRLLNVVEEMAIASGTPVPSVYLLQNESGINAFAAGFSPGQASIAVTQGCIDKLSRDELQGVIGHEFSHILSGDMRLNLRLMGVLHGILVISIIGRILLRTRGKKNPLPLLGVGLMLIGSVGVFFGKLIQAAVSRQREFFADASAVQFTRNPNGLVGALKKIGSSSTGSLITSLHAAEASHFYFSNYLNHAFLGFMSTHPPLVERIKRIDAGFDGKFAAEEEEPAIYENSAQQFLGQIGQPGLEHLAYAGALLNSLPSQLSMKLRQNAGAQAVIFSLLLSSEQSFAQQQLARLAESSDKKVHAAQLQLAPIIQQLGREYYLPLLEMALPVLRTLSKAQYESFRCDVCFFVSCDQRVDLFEFVLEKLLQKHLDPFFAEKQKPAKIVYQSITELQSEMAAFLSVLAYEGHQDTNAAHAAQAFQVAWKRLFPKEPQEILHKEAASLDTLEEALKKFMQSAFRVRHAALDAAVSCIMHDQKITLEEAELLRAIADTLDCPMPPLVMPVVQKVA